MIYYRVVIMPAQRIIKVIKIKMKKVTRFICLSHFLPAHLQARVCVSFTIIDFYCNLWAIEFDSILKGFRVLTLLLMSSYYSRGNFDIYWTLWVISTNFLNGSIMNFNKFIKIKLIFPFLRSPSWFIFDTLSLFNPKAAKQFIKYNLIFFLLQTFECFFITIIW